LKSSSAMKTTSFWYSREGEVRRFPRALSRIKFLERRECPLRVLGLYTLNFNTLFFSQFSGGKSIQFRTALRSSCCCCRA
jgi:hypothetical protein